jgi:cobalt-zinc-cadmium resistance protein CzcA
LRNTANIQDINRIVNTFAGQSTGVVYEGEKRFSGSFRGQKRQDLADVQNLLIPTPNGLQIPLSQLAKLKLLKVRIKYKEDAKLWLVLMFEPRCAKYCKKLQGKVDSN